MTVYCIIVCIVYNKIENISDYQLLRDYYLVFSRTVYTLRFVQPHGKSGDQLVHPESLSARQLCSRALVNDLNCPVVVAAHRGEVATQQSFLALDVRPVFSVLLSEVALSAANKLFAAKSKLNLLRSRQREPNLLAALAGDEVDDVGVSAGGRRHQLVGPAGRVTPEVGSLHQPGAGHAVLFFALPTSRESVSVIPGDCV